MFLGRLWVCVLLDELIDRISDYMRHREKRLKFSECGGGGIMKSFKKFNFSSEAPLYSTS